MTNATLLSSVQLDFHLGNLLAGRFPLDALPSFLHEATHHWCLFNPVGLALTLLNLRARRRALASGDADFPADALDVLDDYARYDAIVRVHAPLAEGLACFAEFDALPGDSSVATQLLHTLVGGLVRSDPNADAWGSLTRALLAARSGRAFVERKTDVLLQGMGRGTAGYLSGYLTVKNLWGVARARADRFADTDLFLNFATNYFYADLGLVAHLLDPDTSDFGAVERIVEYHGQRLVDFARALDSDAVDLLESRQARPLADRTLATSLDDALDDLVNLGTDPELWELGRERLVRMLGHLEQEASAHVARHWLAAIAENHLWLVAKRELLCVGNLDVDVDVSASGMVRVTRLGRRGGEPVLTGPVPDPEAWGSHGTGTLSLFLNPWPWGAYTALVVSLGGRPIVTSMTREVEPVVREQFDHYVESAAELALLDRLLSTQLEDALRADATSEVVLPALRESMDEWSWLTYGRRALLWLDDEALTATLDLMHAHGLYAVLGENVRLVRALAWISLNWRIHAPEELPGAFRDAADVHRAGDDLWAVVATLASLTRERLGEEWVSVVDGRVHCMV
ncbi:MAG: hypothetical protein ACTHOE_03185 [Conexibacter sp.]